MPEPLSRDQRYVPGLDGLRALAVSAVVAYHLGFGWASGGLLGVGVFFTLSGYLITDLLLARLPRGGLRLGQFWLARARRLLPALFVMLAVVVVWVVVSGRPVAEFWSTVVASIFYVANWQLVFQHVSYFARFGPPSPLGHLWSLGIEEQFYLVWPLLLLAGVRFVPERSRVLGVRPHLAAITVLLAAGSAVEMALLYRPSLDPSRVYYGTDTRGFELLAGAALAMVWPSRRLRVNVATGARLLCDLVGLAGLAGILVLVWRTNQYAPFLYRGGFVLLTVATAALVAALVHPAGRIGRVLGIGPLRWIGVRSYGIYLWHMPILALTTPAADHRVELGRAALQVAATLSIAALSWRLIEQPIRHGALGRIERKIRSGEWRQIRVRLPRPDRAALTEAAALPAVAIVALLAAGQHGHDASARPTRTTTASAVLRPIPGIPHLVSSATTGASAAAAPVQSSCRAVIDIGDSTSEGLISPDYLPNPKQRIEAQYTKVGVAHQHYEISGARSIVETYEGQPNAYQVAQEWKFKGYRGCWVLALGTNDTADVAVGSHVNRLARIESMMKLIGNQPVLWVNTKSLLSSGPYAEHNMELWNSALVQACSMYSNMRVFDWASLAKASWFISDGIHYNTPGYAARARLIAQALATAFPASPKHTSCLVR